MFIDQAKIQVKAGRGGKGCHSFFRDRRVKWGKPDGGDGGDGGNISFKTDKSVHTLLDFQFKRHFKAESGHHGSSNHQNGRRGEGLILKIPCGTVLKDAQNGFILRDLIADGEGVVVTKGGKGGKGNSRGRDATDGELGQEREIALELKLIADVGIIGYPNAGKSSFISKVSKAKSKIAGYPFTTKNPILGIVRWHDYQTLTFADMPGLIEGAHRGKGLGDRFLRHIERTRALMHMVDVSCYERPDPYQDYKTIINELKSYSPDLLRKKQVVVLNKIDMPEAKKRLKKLISDFNFKVYPISVLTGEGIPELLNVIFQLAGEESA